MYLQILISDEYLAKIFSHSVCFLLILVIVSYMQKFFSLMQFHLHILALISSYWSPIWKVIAYAYTIKCFPYLFL
jgi:hypothetical protein